MSAEILHVLLILRNQVKLYHWQTFSFGRHKATDDLVTSLDTNIDKFTGGAIWVATVAPSLQLHLENYRFTTRPTPKPRNFIGEAIAWLSKRLPKLLKKEDTDLLNIRDEILADLQQARFLFTLH